jgi:large subunit ribosomal protein L24
VKYKIRKGDTVEVISGRKADKGERGEVIKVYTDKNRVAVQGINIRKKHQGQIQTQGRTMSPGIIEFEGPIHISNVMLVCPSCGKPTRVGISRKDDEAKRVCKRCEALID